MSQNSGSGTGYCFGQFILRVMLMIPAPLYVLFQSKIKNVILKMQINFNILLNI
jgi:hypothetical protein